MRRRRRRNPSPSSIRPKSWSQNPISGSDNPFPARTCNGRPGRSPPPVRYFIRKTDKPNAIEDFSGSIARAPMVAGEPIREAKMIKANGSGFMAAILPSGMRAVSTEISPETGAGGFILPNDHVDVLLSRRDREAEKASGHDSFVSETILNNIRVLAIDQAVEEKNGQKVVVGKTATLELTPRQAETLALARQLGTLSLALRSLADGSKPVTEEKSQPRGSGINTVRFGVTTTTTPR